jgi:hypothetical protein
MSLERCRTPGSGPGGRRFKSSLPDHPNPNYFKQLRRFRGLSFRGGKLAKLANFQLEVR